MQIQLSLHRSTMANNVLSEIIILYASWHDDVFMIINMKAKIDLTKPYFISI